MRFVASLAVSAGLTQHAATASAQGTLLTSANPPATQPEHLLEAAPDPLSPPPLNVCETDLRLSGTVYNARHPERSFATFHVRNGRPGEVYRVGERVAAFEIVSVGPQAVVLDDGGAGCFLKLGDTGVKAAKHAVKKPAPKPVKRLKPSRKQAFTKEELDAAIRPLGSDRYEVKQQLLAQVIARSRQLARSTRWKQVRGYSHVTGLRLTRLAKNGLLERLGLARGDIIKTLNGLQLSSVEGALEAQKLISSTSNLSLLVHRHGKPITLDYRVVP